MSNKMYCFCIIKYTVQRNYSKNNYPILNDNMHDAVHSNNEHDSFNNEQYLNANNAITSANVLLDDSNVQGILTVITFQLDYFCKIHDKY